jgi:TonB family protein
VIILLFAISALAPTEAPLQPTGHWTVGYEDAYCTLRREYGANDRPLTLVFRQIPANSFVSIYMIDTSTRLPRKTTAAITLGQQTFEKNIRSALLNRTGHRASKTGLLRNEFANALVSKAIRIESGKEVNVAFSLPGIEKAVRAWDECTADLLETWGLSREEQAQTASYPEARGGIVSWTDYPDSAIERGASGDALVYVRVDKTGKASNCKVAKSSGEKDLELATCRGMLRAKFKPAVNHAGQPIDSFAAQSMSWSIFY